MHLQTSGSSSTITMTGCPLPASPTLTNPDMILPYQEHDILTPNLPSLWSANAYDFQLPGGPSPQTDMRLMTPKTPMRYGNGTILSDIGEVTEAEGTPGAQSLDYSKRLSKSSLSAHLERSCLTAEQEDILNRIKIRNRQRHISVDSMSTIRDDCVEIFRDIDDNASVDDSVFQGDDEESVANSDIYEFMPLRSNNLMNQENIRSENNDEYPSAVLCKRAERKLLNAKMRLNSMEGKLNLARVSTPVAKSGSGSSACSSTTPTRSTPSSPQINIVSRRTSADKQQYVTPGSPDDGSWTSKEGRQNLSNSFTGRSLGYMTTGSRNLTKNDFSSSKHASDTSQRRGRTFPRSFILSPDKPSYHFIQSLREDYDSSDTKTEQNNGQHYPEKDIFQAEDSKALSRSASLNQMKDIKIQMQGLKGKLSLLRDRARDENVKRRSLQSLRNSSPFTVAEQWRVEKNEQSEGHSSADIMSETTEINLSESNQRDSASPTQFAQKKPNEDIIEDKSISNELSEINGEGDGEIDECASVDTIYHDTMVSHEDREDAFDYEHFFLHSAMGTLSQERRYSFSSEQSVETTRGYSATSSSPELNGHRRSTSTTTLSTMASFATANEQYEAENNDKIAVSNLAVKSTQLSHAHYLHSKVKPKYSSSSSEDQLHTSSKSRTSLPIIKSRNPNRQDLVQNLYGFSNSKGASKLGTSTQNNSPKKNQVELSITSIDRQSLSEQEIDSEADCQIDMITLKPHKQTPIDLLSTNDQTLMRQLLASLGKCAVGLREARTSYEACIWRSRLDAARKVLEGTEDVI